MGDDWQVEATNEHLKVLKNSRNLQQDLDTSDSKSVIRAVTEILREHLIPKPVTDKSARQTLVRSICAEVVRQHNGKVKLGFIIIVTDKKIGGQLSKMPIFVIQFENKTVFVDANGFTYKSWPVFMQQIHKSFPGCKFSYPEGGYYKYDKRLKVNFGTTKVQPSRMWFYVKVAIAAGAIAATFYFCTPVVATMVCNLFTLVAGDCFDGFDVSIFHQILSVFSAFANGGQSILEVGLLIFPLLMRLYSMFKDDIKNVGRKVKNLFWKTWEYLKKWFPRSCTDASEPPMRLLAITSSSDEYVESTVNNVIENNADISKIFENCQYENVFHHNYKPKSDNLPQDLTPVTKSLLNTSESIVNKLPKIQSNVVDPKIVTQNDLADIFQNLQTMFLKDFKEKYHLYSLCLKYTANLSTEKAFDVEKFNKEMGIEGDAKNHFMKKSLDYVMEPEVLNLTLKKCIELKEEEPVTLIHIINLPNHNKLGLYRFIGRGKGLLPASTLVKPLSKLFDVDEDTVVLKEENHDGESARVTILFDNFIVFIYQKINEGNDVDGMLFAIDNPK